MSKNRAWRSNRGRVHLDPAYAAARDALALEVRSRIRATRATLAHNRLWVWCHVERQDLAGDAHNALPLVLDAIQIATGLDDRWYQVGGATWGLSPGPASLVVTIGQEDLPDVLACAGCASLLPPDAFPSGALDWPPHPSGRRRKLPKDRGTCLSCSRARRTAQRASTRKSG